MLPETCPDYAIRKAPFWVLDCLRPLPDGGIPAEEGRCCHKGAQASTCAPGFMA